MSAVRVIRQSLASAAEKVELIPYGQEISTVMVREIPPAAAGLVSLRFGQASDAIPLLGTAETFDVCPVETQGLFLDISIPLAGTLVIAVTFEGGSVRQEA